uniref:Small ribosomal subunit protein uS3c n=1 Tax=Protohalopteris sp. TaxID=2843287 RepID=A0A8F0JYH0_9PHAE|nr:ribosomal protein S3 [Protohalopteris sp.]
MGHKTHPLGFRLGIVQQDRSLWYSNRASSYINFLKQDYAIREVISQTLKSNNLVFSGITKIIIRRPERKKKVYIEIQSAVPSRIVGNSGSTIRNLDKRLSTLLKPEKVLLNIVEIEEPYAEAVILVDILVKKLEERTSFRRCIRAILQRYRTVNEINGIKIQIAGRLNGAEIARTEWVREGRVPLQTLRADIDYCYKTAQTIYGILGIKIWLFKTEVLNEKLI